MFEAIFLMIALALPVAAESVDGFQCGPGHTYECDNAKLPTPAFPVDQHNIHGDAGKQIR